MIIGLIASGSVQQHKTALGFMGSAKQASICARIRNFLKSFDLNFSDYAKAVVAIAQLKGALSLVLDRTNWKFGRIEINLLVLAVVVADREFVGKKWVDYLIQNNIPFFIRIKENRLVEWGEDMCHISSFFRHLKGKQKRHLQFDLDGHMLFFAGTLSQDNELVIVMSNQDIGPDILRIYKKRWTIDLMFGHCKKNGFNLEDTHLVNLDRIEKLFAVVGSSLLLCLKAGEREEHKSPTPYKKTVQTPAFSTFRRGFDFLRKLLFQVRDQALELLASFLETPLNQSLSSKLQEIIR